MSFKEALHINKNGKLFIPEYLIAGKFDDENSAYMKGKEALFNNCSIDDNPYKDKILKKMWLEGFMDADEEV